MEENLEREDRDLLIELRTRLKTLEERVTSLLGNGSPKFVPTREFDARFEPVKAVVYGLVALILLAVGGVLISSVLRKGAP